MCVQGLANYLNLHYTNLKSLVDLKYRNLSKLLFQNLKKNISKNQKRSIHSAFNATVRLKTKLYIFQNKAITKSQQNLKSFVYLWFMRE